MGAYQYQALKKNGSNHKGVIEADSERQARQLLREQGLIPTHIQTLAQQRKNISKSKMSAADLSLMTRQLATLLAAGIPVEESLRGVSEQTEKIRCGKLLLVSAQKYWKAMDLPKRWLSIQQPFLNYIAPLWDQVNRQVVWIWF